MSQPRHVTYGELIETLGDLGFQDESVEGSHQAFRHAASDTLILLAPATSEALVRQEDLLSVRHHLDFKGLLDGKAFDRRFPHTTFRRK